MPRPRVPPNLRQRAAEACNNCRETKKRCSGFAPCNHCLRRGLEHECFMTYAPRGSRARRAKAKDAGDVMQVATNAPQATENNDDFQPMSPSDSRPDEGEESNDPSASVNSSRMLRNLRGERVYIGGAASISFLEVARRLVVDSIGPSPFSHNDKNDTMLETESPESSRHEQVVACNVNPIEVARGLDTDQKLEYLQCYHTVTEAFIDILDPSELEHLVVEGHDISSQSSYRIAIAELVIAIGAQCHSEDIAKSIGLPYFRRAQRRACADMLEDPELDMVRVFLLMAFYMLGECRRNSAFMYLGVAVRAALCLGMHTREAYGEAESSHARLRLRLWMSVRIMDKLVNSLLGRPTATAGVDANANSCVINDLASSENHATRCLVAAHNIITIINDITDRIYDRKEIDVSIVEQFLQKIEAWKRELPQSVQSPTPVRNETQLSSSSSLPPKRGLIGNIHVSCLYYFAVTLVTRPIFVANLTACTAPGEAQRSPLAAACLDAAKYLVQTCMSARKAGLLKGNMCIVKALVFAAGLVLGLETFARNPAEDDIETASNDARTVLKFLAKQSPQAAHYWEILTSLANAVAKRRSTDSSTRRRRYVSKIFSLDPTPERESQTQQIGMEQIFSPQQPSDDLGDSVADWAFENFDMGDLCFDGGSLDISAWDGFPFLS